MKQKKKTAFFSLKIPVVRYLDGFTFYIISMAQSGSKNFKCVYYGGGNHVTHSRGNYAADEHTKKNLTGVYKYCLWGSSSHEHIVAFEK